MPEYRLKEQQAGSVVVADAEWQFWVITLSSLPDNTPISHTIIFGNNSFRGDLLRKVVAGNIETLSDAQLAELALHADSRDVPSEGGRVTILPPHPYADGKMWTVILPNGQVKRNSIAVEKAIGALSEEDIRQLAAT